jgi:hypothetical protein
MTHRFLIVASLLAVAPVACAGSGLLFPIDPSRAYLRTCSDPAGLPRPGFEIIDLDAAGFAPGDRIRVQAVGDFSFFDQPGPEDGNLAIAVFSTNGVVLADREVLHRVPGAIASDAPPFPTPTNNPCPDGEVDIPEDFLCDGVEVSIPDRGDGRAAFLIATAYDELYSDNRDDNGNFGVMLTVIPPSPCNGLGVIADSIADYAGTQGGNGWRYGYSNGGFNGTNGIELPYYGSVRLPSGVTITEAWALAQVPGNYLVVRRNYQHPNTNQDIWRSYEISSTGSYRVLVFIEVTPGPECSSNDGTTTTLWLNGSAIASLHLGPAQTGAMEHAVVAKSGDRLTVSTTDGANRNCDTTRTHVVITDGCTTECNPADLAQPLGTLDLADINAFTAGFTAMDAIADLNADGLFDLADITAFVASFLAGCP